LKFGVTQTTLVVSWVLHRLPL